MKIHEYQAVQLFKEAGIPVIEGSVATDVNQALKIAETIGYPVVLKSQVLVGGRGKAGGIKIVKDDHELKNKFNVLKKLRIKGYPVNEIFIVRAINIKKEFYLAVTIDHAKDDIVLIASGAGGVEIEETAKTNPEAIKKYYLQGEKRIDESRWPEFIQSIFDEPQQQDFGTKIFQNLTRLFFQYDCSLAEINPFVIDDKAEGFAADAKINFDDNALFRHKDLLHLKDMTYEDPDEVEAKENDLSFVKLDGDIGCIVNGAGLAMATMDIIKLLGGNPANFLDVGGSSSPEKVLKALTIVLRNKSIKVVLINIFGGITRCDDIAKGILEARKSLNFSVPIVVRLTGTNESQAKELLSANDIHTFSTMLEAVNRVVEISGKPS